MNIKSLDFIINANGDKRAGLLAFPQDYDTNPDPCGLIVFFHGAGEFGDGTQATLGSIANGGTGLYKNGSPFFIAANREMNFVNPITGKLQRFIVFGLQGIRGWCCQSEEVEYALVNDILKNYKIDSSLIGAYGLSAGGEEVWEAITYSNSAIWCYAVPMSAATIEASKSNFQRIVDNQIKIWPFHGLQDGGQTDEWNTISYVAKVDALQTGLTHPTYYQGGHGLWEKFFDPGYTEPIAYDWDGNGIPYVKQLNIYEIHAACKKAGKFRFAPASTATPSTNPPNMSINAVVTAIANGNIITLDNTQSTGNIGAWDYILDPSSPTKSSLLWDNGKADGGAQLGLKKVTVLAGPGTYVFKLTVYGRDGVNASKTVQVSVGSVQQPPPPPPSKTLLATIVNQKTGHNIGVYDDDSASIL